MHFSYVKSNILCKWLSMLCKFLVTMFTPEYSLLQRSESILLQPPCLTQTPIMSTNLPASPTCQHPHPARHPTLPATPLCQQSFPDSVPCCPPQPLQPLERCNALVPSSVLQGCVCGVQVNVQPPPIFYTHHQISFFPPKKNFYLPYISPISKIFYLPYQIFYVLSLIFFVPLQFYIKLTCDAACEDTRSALPLPLGLVNC